MYNVTTIAAPATALDTVIPRDTVPVATANAHCVTEWGSIRPNKFADNVEALLIEMEMDAFAADCPSQAPSGAWLAWTPRRLYYGDGMAHPPSSRCTARATSINNRWGQPGRLGWPCEEEFLLPYKGRSRRVTNAARGICRSLGRSLGRSA